MERAANLEHWERLAREYGTELGATTKCESLKRLEVAALGRRLRQFTKRGPANVLEVGCGHGINGFMLADSDPGVRYVGLDFSKTMIESASTTVERTLRKGGAALASRMSFGVADARTLRAPIHEVWQKPNLVGSDAGSCIESPAFDVVFTDRMLINLSSDAEQLAVMRKIAGVVRPGGVFLMLENSRQTHARLNEVRMRLGLQKRAVAEYNIFIDETSTIEAFKQDMVLEDIEDFGAFHDLMLYAVEPAARGTTEIAYDSPIMTQLTNALEVLGEWGLEVGRGFGQNRLWVWRKGEAAKRS